MSAHFFYEDGRGKIIDEKGNDAMDWEEDVNPYHLETLTNLRKYCEAQELEQASMATDLDTRMQDIAALEKAAVRLSGCYNDYSSEKKLLFVCYNRVKLFNAAKSGRLAGGIAERTAQKWAKRLKEDKDWNILEKQTNKVNRNKSQLNEEHKSHLINFYDDHPQARVIDAVTSLTETFENFSLKETTV